ncbi:DUF983 domain-containing protein [Algoriphagus oliviformis]|nr:DUF983 domain-containing protein [Algoriphagus oliviformis]
MESSPSVFTTILTCKCPKCRKGAMFPKGNFAHPTKFHQMNKSCEVCGQSFEPEPGFYFGAMFVSYGLNTALFITAWVALSVIMPDYSLSTLLILLGLTVLLSLPLIFRLSRSIWIAIFVPYRAEFAKSQAKPSDSR